MPVQPDAFRIQSYLELVEGIGNGIAGLSREAFTDALRDLVQMFESLQVPFALFGAFAVAAYVSSRRSTLDIDIVSSGEAIDSVRQAAKDYGFREVSPEDTEARVVCFRHRGGAKVDIIFDSRGFVNLDKAQILKVPGIGDIPVGRAVDVACSKIRTQSAKWNRLQEKRLIDRADLTAMLRDNPGLAEALRDRLAGMPVYPAHVWAPDRPILRAALARLPIYVKRTGAENSEMFRILQTVCREAGITLPALRRSRWWVSAAIIAGFTVLGLLVVWLLLLLFGH